MKLINNIKAWFQAKIDKYVIKRFATILPKPLIKSLYRQIAESDLQITTKEVQVKKGKRKYTLLVVKDKNLQTVFNLGRYDENEESFPSIAEMQRVQKEALVHVTMANGEQADVSTKDMPEDYSFETGV